jgi:FkbM family methyltransferase
MGSGQGTVPEAQGGELPGVRTAERYSQHGEQDIILGHFGDRVGRFLDVGAGDGTTFSNTRALAERGWSGVLVEASPLVLHALEKLYGGDPRFEIVCAAVGTVRAALVDFWDSPDCVGTTQAAHVELWKVRAPFTKIQLSQITIADITNKLGGGFDFVNIDTEGTSLHIFKSLDAEFLKRTRCFCIEHDGGPVEIANHAERSGHRTIYLNGTNIILAQPWPNPE